jgi:hypothetical protein
MQTAAAWSLQQASLTQQQQQQQQQGQMGPPVTPPASPLVLGAPF